jgi:hypothetical protein
MKNILIFIAVMLMYTSKSYSQFYTRQNMVWTFGEYVGLNFNSGTPVPFSTSLNTLESCASVCNSSGNLLFYTDGKKVHNRFGALMPHGASIVSYGTSSTIQGAIITPFIGDTNKYYIFSLQNFEDATDTMRARLSYSVVDMTLNGGMGDVVEASAGTFLYGRLTEGMVAITGNNNNIWLVTHRTDTTVFVVFNISSTGVSPTPTLYAPGTQFACQQAITLKASHDRRKLAYSGFQCMNKVTLFDFDAGTGAITNPQPIMTLGATYNYSFEFSPDNSKLYINAMHGGPSPINSIKQYDLTVPTSAAMLASEINLTEGTFGTMRLAPDGKIYFLNYNTNTIGCINAPNNTGTASDLVVNAITTLHQVRLGLPPIYVTTDTNFTPVPPPPTVVGETLHNRGISVYPNPAKSLITLQSTVPVTTIQLYDILGREIVLPIKKSNSNKMEIDVVNLPAGTYIMRVNEQLIQRFFKE